MGDPLYPASRLDGNQVLTHAFDEETQRLRTDADVSVISADIHIELDAADDSVSIGDAAGDFLDINPDGSINAINTSQLIPFKYDKIEILAKNANGDPLSVQYSQSGSTVATLTIVYDIDGDISTVTRS